MVSQEEYLEEAYGPAARYAEHWREDTITYRDIETGESLSGEEHLGRVWLPVKVYLFNPDDDGSEP